MLNQILFWKQHKSHQWISGKVKKGPLRESYPYRSGSRNHLLRCHVEHSWLHNYGRLQTQPLWRPSKRQDLLHTSRMPPPPLICTCLEVARADRSSIWRLRMVSSAFCLDSTSAVYWSSLRVSCSLVLLRRTSAFRCFSCSSLNSYL